MKLEAKLSFAGCTAFLWPLRVFLLEDRFQHNSNWKMVIGATLIFDDTSATTQKYRTTACARSDASESQLRQQMTAYQSIAVRYVLSRE